MTNTIFEFFSSRDTNERFARCSRTLARLDEFGRRKAGWDLGRGEVIRPTAIEDARLVLQYAFDIGLWQSNTFASPSGSVLLTFTGDEFDIEIGIEGDKTFDLTYERSGEIAIEETAIDSSSLFLQLHKIADAICTSELSTQITMMKTQDDFAAQLLNRPAMAAYPSFVKVVERISRDQPANILPSIMRTSPEPLPYFGYYQKPIYQMELIAS